MALTTDERVLNRARSLMQNRGYGWSKAIAIAADLTGATTMQQLEVWWSPAAECWRVEDNGTMFTYYSIDLVVGHFVHRERPAGALVSYPPASAKVAELMRAFKAAGVEAEYQA